MLEIKERSYLLDPMYRIKSMASLFSAKTLDSSDLALNLLELTPEETSQMLYYIIPGRNYILKFCNFIVFPHSDQRKMNYFSPLNTA